MTLALTAPQVDSLGLAAFESPNFPPLATIGARLHPARHLWRPPPTARLRVHAEMDSNIVVVRLAPGFDDSMLHSMVVETKHLHGMVLSLYGTGNGPASKQSFLDLIKVRREGGTGVGVSV
jgi:L-asparaginase